MSRYPPKIDTCSGDMHTRDDLPFVVCSARVFSMNWEYQAFAYTRDTYSAQESRWCRTEVEFCSAGTHTRNGDRRFRHARTSLARKRRSRPRVVQKEAIYHNEDTGHRQRVATIPSLPRDDTPDSNSAALQEFVMKWSRRSFSSREITRPPLRVPSRPSWFLARS